jgi:hypothetical protein
MDSLFPSILPLICNDCDKAILSIQEIANIRLVNSECRRLVDTESVSFSLHFENAVDCNAGANFLQYLLSLNNNINVLNLSIFIFFLLSYILK